MLKIENLYCGYDSTKPVIKGLSFEIAEGHFVGIVGPNGSGKTTLLRAIMGLVNISRGNIKIQGHSIATFSRRELARRIAFIPQLMEPVLGFTVTDMIMLGRTPHIDRFSFGTEEDRKVVQWAIEELKAESLQNRDVSELSGGEFQRVALARALAQESRILLLDEPTSHLDIRYQVKICRLLKGLRSKRTIIATFHDLNIASRFCSKLLLLKNGQIIAEGSPDEVVTAQNIWKAYQIKVTVRKNPRTQKARYVLLP